MKITVVGVILIAALVTASVLVFLAINNRNNGLNDEESRRLPTD